ncbi:MAG: tetratricopeptide repeat protein [Pseudobacter sp.]|uniref:tetratricopeptide repeat protein n=1 Tax=Pseudobacter sp. TaxID=2045420 RepID=UPI003F8156C8
MKKHLLVLFFSVLFFSGHAQDALQPGYVMLEKGEFAAAAVFFGNYLQKDPGNRTARLCYGRAIGLSGQPETAKKIFDSLLIRYPGDFEILLNSAEALMWNKEFEQAKNAYYHLLLTQPENFPATLGYANALSGIRSYDSALVHIDKALRLMPGNANAMVSRKYTRLALADQLMKLNLYDQATSYLQQNLKDFPEDGETMFVEAQLLTMTKKFREALFIQKQLLQKRKRAVDAALGISYILFLQKKKKLSLVYADTAVMLASDTSTMLRARLGRVVALGWNEKFAAAFRELDSLEAGYPRSTDIQVKRAMLLAWQKNFGKSELLFRNVLQQQPTSFDANMGLADALFARELDQQSYSFLDSTLHYYPGQKDAREFMQKISLRHAPTITADGFRSTDKGGNESYNYHVGVAFDIVPRLRMAMDYRARHTRDKHSDQHASNEHYTLGLRYRVSSSLLLNGALNSSQLNGTENKHQLLADIAAEWKFARWHTAELRYRSDVQNFTTSLINSNITMNNYILTYNLVTPVKLGLFSQYYYTSYSDHNNRGLLFASLYYNILTDPVWKAGINYNQLRFDDQVPAKYFSPEQFRSYELFSAVENLEIPGKKWLYQALVAGGFQKIDKESGQAIYRFNVTLGYKPAPAFQVLAYFLHSNSASSTVAGFTYSEMGIKIKYILLQWYKGMK